jgi:REP element-mobilizing transposase RayT
MPQSLAKILVHTVFSTKDRHPFLRDKALRAELHRYLGGILANHGCQPLIVGGVDDHVHLLSTLSRTCEVADLVKELKRGSSLWVKTKGPDLRDFAWQNGYGIFSIGFSQIEGVRNYIAGQEEHHRKVPFKTSSVASCGDMKLNSMNGMFGIDATPLELLNICNRLPSVAASRQRWAR